MAKHVGIYEMRAKLGELVRAASGGETIIVDVRGRPAAKLVPYNDSAHDVVAWFKERATGEPWGVSARDLVVEGRR
ncbi:MAG TPA: type II toxin-antitoxin system prevent-host-death family antitoxin [Candidatus Baltobacteraceae bacterium]|nr:type II toxin-antitoxin system prevent-host-death family antitoxin [Candidatus Baltobacteraceae bacterium]